MYDNHTPLTRVMIAIQARTNSTRLPGKVMKDLHGKRILDHVLDACLNASRYQNKFMDLKRVIVDVALVVPENDPIISAYENVLVYEGSEKDVLSRYYQIIDQADRPAPDYIVRITSDCPLIPPFVITKLITTALTNRYDYVSNTDERCRTAPDGWDCEVISKRLLKYAHENATDPYDREHVTPFMRSFNAPWVKRGTVINFIDLSRLKLSIDTEYDLERVRSEIKDVTKAYNEAQALYGRKNVHRF